jgi:hypothetical protein
MLRVRFQVIIVAMIVHVTRGFRSACVACAGTAGSGPDGARASMMRRMVGVERRYLSGVAHLYSNPPGFLARTGRTLTPTLTCMAFTCTILLLFVTSNLPSRTSSPKDTVSGARLCSLTSRSTLPLHLWTRSYLAWTRFLLLLHLSRGPWVCPMTNNHPIILKHATSLQTQTTTGLTGDAALHRGGQES